MSTNQIKPFEVMDSFWKCYAYISPSTVEHVKTTSETVANTVMKAVDEDETPGAVRYLSTSLFWDEYRRLSPDTVDEVRSISARAGRATNEVIVELFMNYPEIAARGIKSDIVFVLMNGSYMQ